MSASIWESGTIVDTIVNSDNSFLFQSFTPTQGQTVFDLTNFAYAVGTSSLEIFVNGVHQMITRDFLETSTTRFTLTSGAEATDVIDARGLIGSAASQNATASATAAAASAASAAASLAAITALNIPNLPLTLANGGTGQVTKAAAFIGLAPTIVKGKAIGSLDGATYVAVARNPIDVYSNIVVSTTLTAATIGYHNVAMTSIGKSITLPDATTLPSVNHELCVVSNVLSTYPVGIRDSAGVLLAAVAPGGIATLSCNDISTAAGVWQITGNNLEPGLTTIDSTLSATYVDSAQFPYASLDANTTIHFAAIASGFAAFIVDNLGQVVTTPVSVSATASDVPVQVFKIDATHAIVFYGQTGTNTHKAVVLTISGASPSLSLAVGTPQTFTVAASMNTWGGENSHDAPKIVQLASGLYACVYCSSTTVTAVVGIAVAGAVVTIAAATNIITANCIVASTTAYALTATTLLCLYKSSAGAAPYANNAIVCTITAGTGASAVGSPVALTNCASTQNFPPSSTLVSATKAIVVDDNNTTQVTAITVTIAGTVVTAGTALNVETGITLPATGITYGVANSTRYIPHLWSLSAGSSNLVGLWYMDSTPISRAVILTETAGTIVAGAIQYRSISGGASITNGTIFPPGVTEFMSVISKVIGSSGNQVLVSPCKISGAVITQGAGKTVDLSGIPSSIACNKLSNGKYVLVGTLGGAYNASLDVMSSNGDFINYLGKISVPAILPLSYGGPTPSIVNPVSGNRLISMGTTSLGNNVLSATYQIRILNVEIAK